MVGAIDPFDSAQGRFSIAILLVFISISVKINATVCRLRVATACQGDRRYSADQRSNFALLLLLESPFTILSNLLETCA